MAPHSLTSWTLVCPGSLWEEIYRHHFPGDDDEHGSVLLCSVVEPDGPERRLLVREFVPAVDGVAYTKSPTAYRALSAAFVCEQIGRAETEQLAYLAVHNHDADACVGFSDVDMRSHEYGYPALLGIANGVPVGALVLGHRAVAGDIWEKPGRTTVSRAVVVGPRRLELFPAPPTGGGQDELYDRQVRLFGDRGQHMLRRLKVGVVGAGGAGSLLVQALAHLGVGELVVIDDDHIERSNLTRVVGSLPLDACDDSCAWPGTLKVDVLRRLALTIRPSMRFRAFPCSIVEPKAANFLRDCDAIFLAADSASARRTVNAICHQYLVPGFQMGAKVVATPEGRVVDAFAVSRMFGPVGMCLECAGLIDAHKLQLEALGAEERRAAQYVPEVADPSVITMNMTAVAQSLNDFLFMFTGLVQTDDVGPRRQHFLTREPVLEDLPKARVTCEECSGRLAMGDKVRLPTKWSDEE